MRGQDDIIFSHRSSSHLGLSSAEGSLFSRSSAGSLWTGAAAAAAPLRELRELLELCDLHGLLGLSLHSRSWLSTSRARTRLELAPPP
ncbi:hypothetical protein EYF80_040109 [Liparis tanakae]|uniref:Uncharacterized protein n=1 Tax=Liparis tanakae TaxID=230148 RepID=A0A4Z2G816_9TELE|nr:hypothetical protein EYF80_040109 [Liparis tanakae]